MTQPIAIIGRDTGSMMRANERDFHFAIQQRQFPAKMTNRIRLRLLRRVTEMFHHRIGQIECGDQFRTGLLPDLHRVTDVIGMTVRNQDEIDVFEPGNFFLRIFENRIREPRIDEQNFSARRHNLESRLTVPSKLRIHGNHETETAAQGKSGEKLFFELALEDIREAADLFRPVHDRTCGVDGWVSLEVSPLLAHDTKSTIAEAKDLHRLAQRPNVFIKIPGTPEGLPAIEEAIFAGVPINVTLLFSDDQYVAAANAFMRGIERRIEAGLTPDVASVASLFISRWDVAVTGKVPAELNNRLGIAVAKRTYKAYRDLLTSPRWMRAYNAGARPQRLLWASTGTKDPKASDVLYVNSLAAPFTVNTMPEGTLKALADHGQVEATLGADGGNSEEELARFAKAKIDVDALSRQLQDEGAKSFVKSWKDLMDVIGSKSAVLERAS